MVANYDPPKNLFIDKGFFNRLLSRESSTGNTSCRVYYGVAPGEIPFQWESRPGTPKRPTTNDAILPLTPPPSFLTFSRPLSEKTKSWNPSRIAFLSFLPWKKQPLSTKKQLSVVQGLSSLSNSSNSSSSSSSRGSNEELEFVARSRTWTLGLGPILRNRFHRSPMVPMKNVLWPRSG